MARYWKEKLKGKQNLLLNWRYYVHVCSFTFVFASLSEIEEYRDYFSQKIHPSSADDVDWRNCRWWTPPNERGFSWALDHWERQSRFDRLPLFLFEEPKRQKVVKALNEALKKFSE